MKKSVVFLTLSLCLCLLLGYSAQANASSVPWYMFEVNQVSDNSGEYLLNKVYADIPTGWTQGQEYLYSGSDGGGNYYYTTDNSDTLLQVGDRLRGGFTIDTIEGMTTGTTTNIATLQFTGVFELEVIDRTYMYTHSTYGDIYDYEFGPSSDFESTYCTGALVAQYLDDTTMYNRQTASDDAPGVADEESQIDLADNGSLYWVMGFTGAGGAATGGEGWESRNSPEDVDIFSYIATTTNVGTAHYALNLVDNPHGPPLGLVNQDFAGLGDLTPVNMAGTASLNGIWDSTQAPGTGIPPFDNWNDMNARVKPVPEPATMLLLGTGLIGLAGWGRKKRFFKKAKDRT